MILTSLRYLTGATVLLALAGANPTLAQSGSFAHGSNDSLVTLAVATLLPDAPSYSTSQQSPAPPAQSAPAQSDPAQVPPPPQETDAERKAREQREEAAREVKTEETQRIGGIIPNFNVALNGQGVPLTPKQKLDLSFHTIIDPYTFAIAFLFGGGYGELVDDHTGYGHGPAGFFKRTGASYADNVDGNFIGNALLPILLHQDPRYFRKGTGSIKSRIIYSALSSFICRGDNGKRQFNTSNVLGNFISGAISNLYYPASERGIGLAITNASVVTLEGGIGGQLLEFSPDVTEKLRQRHQRKLAEKAAAAAAASGQSAPPATPPQP